MLTIIRLTSKICVRRCTRWRDSLSFEYELTGIGIGAPNANFHKGTVENPANLWKFREGDPNPDESRRLFPLADDIRQMFRRREGYW